MIYWDQSYTFCRDWSGDQSTTILANFKLLLNIGYKEVLHTFSGEETEDIRTSYTQTGIRAIKLPPSYIRIHSITATIGNQIYTLVEEESQDMFNDRLWLNRTSSRPEVYFIRPRFGTAGSELLLDPIPSGTDCLITINYASNARDLAVDKYVTGTVIATNASQTITGSGTTFTASMVGRYFKVNDETGDGNWYRITGFTSTTSITIENKYDGVTTSGKSFIIAEAFALPEDLQMAPTYYAMYHYYLGYRADKDEKRSAIWESRYKLKKKEAEVNYKKKSKSNVLRDKSKATGWPTLPSNWPENVT